MTAALPHQEAYQKLKARFAQITALGNAAEILGNDSETAMPAGSGAARTEQIMAIAAAQYSLMNDPMLKALLNEAENKAAALTPEDRRNLALMWQQWIHTTALPEDLANEVARIGSEGRQRHVRNFRSGDWNTMKDWYAHSFAIAREVGEAKKDKLSVATPYEALLDQFSPGINTALIDREFARLERELPALVQQATARQNAQPAPLPLQGTFTSVRQMKINHMLAHAVNFDYTRGRLDSIPGHPTTSGPSDDSRITTQCDKRNFLKSLYSTVHEAGHGLYEQNLPAVWRYQPAGANLGMAIHESQSMIIELQACGLPEFFRFLEPPVRAVFRRAADPALSAQNMQRLIHRVEPSLIRIYADELTYPAHVALRYRLERDIIGGKLDAKDIPEAWNEGMKTLLGITPPDPSQGCMQDVHWPTGAIGYFPAYTLGAMGAAQFFAAARKAHPEIPAEIEKGNFSPLTDWLKTNVHSKGSLLTASELFRNATGAELNTDAYLEHLSHRYTGKAFTPAP